MTFTDDDLKRLKEEFEPYVEGDARILTGSDWLGLVARLEAAEKFVPKSSKGLTLDEYGELQVWLKATGK